MKKWLIGVIWAIPGFIGLSVLYFGICYAYFGIDVMHGENARWGALFALLMGTILAAGLIDDYVHCGRDGQEEEPSGRGEG